MRVSFRSFCPPYVRGDVVELPAPEAMKFIAKGLAVPVEEKQDPPAPAAKPVKASPAKPKKRGRPRKKAAAPKADAGE